MGGATLTIDWDVPVGAQVWIEAFALGVPGKHWSNGLELTVIQ